MDKKNGHHSAKHLVKTTIPFFPAVLACGIWPGGFGETSPDARVKLRGFGTLGGARSSSDQAEFIRDLSQPRGLSNHWSGRIDSVLGGQANWQINSTLELVGQVVSRYHYDSSRNPELMWAFAKWDPDARLSLRAGRIGADFMMSADSRLVNYASLTVRPAADFFGPLFFSHFDGADAILTLPHGGGLLRSKVFAGATHEKTIGTPGVWDTSGSPVSGLVLDYLTGPWQFRASATNVRFSHDINFSALTDPLRTTGSGFGYPSAIAAAEALRAKNTTSRFYSLGVVYDDGPLQIQGMLNSIDHETATFQNSHAGYVLAGYRLGSVTPYSGVSWWKTSAKSNTTGLPSGVGFDSLIQNYNQVMAASAVDQQTYTLGLRWDVQRNVAIKTQWDAIRGTSGSVFPFANVKSGWNGRTDVLSLSLDFIF